MNEHLINLDDYVIATDNGESISVGFHDVTFVSDGETRYVDLTPPETAIEIELDAENAARIHKLMDAHTRTVAEAVHKDRENGLITAKEFNEIMEALGLDEREAVYVC